MANSLSEIQLKIKALQEQEQKLIEAAKSDVIQELKEKISAYKISFEELGFVAHSSNSSKKIKTDKVPAEAKYRDPVSGSTWSGGRGKRPAWIKTLAEQWEQESKKFEDEIQTYLIQK